MEVSAMMLPIITKEKPKVVAFLPIALKPKKIKKGAKNSNGKVIAINLIPLFNFVLSVSIIYYLTFIAVPF